MCINIFDYIVSNKRNIFSVNVAIFLSIIFCLSPGPQKFLRNVQKMPFWNQIKPFDTPFSVKRGTDNAQNAIGRTDLSVVYAYEVQHKLSIIKQIVCCCQCHTCCDDVVEHYHSPLADRSQQHKVGGKSAPIDTLNGIAVEWNVEDFRNLEAYCTRKMETVVVPPPRSGDDAHIIE